MSIVHNTKHYVVQNLYAIMENSISLQTAKFAKLHKKFMLHLQETDCKLLNK